MNLRWSSRMKPLKILAIAAVSASDLAQNRLLGSIAGTNKSEEPIEAAITYPEGAFVIE